MVASNPGYEVYTIYGYIYSGNRIDLVIVLNQACTGVPGFFNKFLCDHANVCMCVCVCPEAINNWRRDVVG